MHAPTDSSASMPASSLPWLDTIRWRIEAVRTRRPYSDVVLHHTLLYQIRQILLIHRRSGLVVAHAVDPQDMLRDADRVSGMVTAVRNFARDSCDKPEAEPIESLRMGGDHSVWLEQREEAMLAVVIRGNAPLALRDSFRALLYELHLRFRDQWRSFAGDTMMFAQAQPRLEAALTRELIERPRRSTGSPILPWAVGGSLGLLALVLGGRALLQEWRWGQLEARLQAHPGLVVVKAEHRGGELWIEGMLDPLADDPRPLVDSMRDQIGVVHTSWARFDSLEDELTLKRAHARLTPPAGVEMRLEDGVLTLSGSATHRWIARSLRQAVAIPGVRRVVADDLVDPTRMSVRSLIEELESIELWFDVDSTRVSDEQLASIDRAAELIPRMRELAPGAELGVIVTIVGSADPSGEAGRNRELSAKRALNVQRLLSAREVEGLYVAGIGEPRVEPASADAQDPTEEGAPGALQALRSVTFSVLATSPEAD